MLKCIEKFQNQLAYIQLDYEKCLFFFLYNRLSIARRKKYWKREKNPTNINDAFALAFQLKFEEQGIGHSK